MQDNTLRRITLAAVIASVVLVATMFLKVPTLTGYVHLGDGVIFAASLALGPTLGGLSAAIGSTLADILSAYAMWAPWTFFIKGGAGVIVGLAGNARTHRSHIAGMIAAAVWIIIGVRAVRPELLGAVTGRNPREHSSDRLRHSHRDGARPGPQAVGRQRR